MELLDSVEGKGCAMCLQETSKVEASADDPSIRRLGLQLRPAPVGLYNESVDPLRAWVQGVLRKGYGVASGPSADYPYGALERQVPLFKIRGLDLGDCYLGTLNIDIRPFVFELVRPEFTLHDVRWTDLHPPEHFSFSRCRVAFSTAEYPGWIYYPHPETKRRNYQDPSLLEVICPHISGLTVGDILRVSVDPDRVALRPPSG